MLDLFQDSEDTIHKQRYHWLALIALLIMIWLPRGLKLDQYVTVDESKWVTRSGNFFEALVNDHYQHTYQHAHPGVTIMWSGTAGYLWQFPEYARNAPGQFTWTDRRFDDFIRTNGHELLEMLVGGRTFVVLINTVVLGLAFMMTRRLVGFLPALLGFVLIAFDPFQTAHSRFMHPDSLLSVFMLLSMLAFLSYLYTGRRRRDLIISALSAGLAALTKTPGIFLFPLIGLFSLIAISVDTISKPGWQIAHFWQPKTIGRLALPILVWLGIAVVIYFALWPALWVTPLDTLSAAYDITDEYASVGHSSPVFYNGRILNGDPGTFFYPVSYLWRTTPVVLLGLLLAIVAFVGHWGPFDSRVGRIVGISFLLHVLFFFIFMNLGAKKFDRYFLPIYMPLDLLAGLGWVALVTGLAKVHSPTFACYAPIALLIVIITGQAGLSLRTFPYYLSYYNPLMGGESAATKAMIIGWGEGLDQAARYLNETVEPEKTRASSWYPRGPFSYHYAGETVSNRHFWESDYAVIYYHQWQRQLPSRRMLSYFNQLEPEKTFWINGLEYARLYNMQETQHPDYSVEWGEAIRLVYYDTFSGAMYPGMEFDMTFYFIKVAPIAEDWSILVRMVHPGGYELLKVEGWPKGYATSSWQVGELLRDNSYETVIPQDAPPGFYRIEIAFYDPDTLERQPITSANTGEARSDPYVLDYLIVGDPPEVPLNPLEPTANLGGQVSLIGVDLLGADQTPIQNNSVQYRPGDQLDLRAFWRAEDFMYVDYTAFAHLVGPDGQLVAQQDQRPMGGFLTTSLWPPTQVIADEYNIQIPTDAAPGEYRLHMGMYDLATMQRLPIQSDGQIVGDSVVVVTIPVGTP